MKLGYATPKENNLLIAPNTNPTIIQNPQEGEIINLDNADSAVQTNNVKNQTGGHIVNADRIIHSKSRICTIAVLNKIYYDTQKAMPIKICKTCNSTR